MHVGITEWPAIEDACRDGLDVLLAKGSAPVEVRQLSVLVREYGRLLGRIHRAQEAKRKPMIDRVATSSFAARVCALLRSPSLHEWDCTELRKLANQLEFLKPLTETVNAYWQIERGKARLIVPYGPMRRAQSVFLDDIMAASGLENAHDYSRKGKGERALSERVIQKMKGGTNYWWAPDIKACFPSLRPGHFRKLPLDRRLVRNVGFLPKGSHIQIQLPKGELRDAVKAELVKLLGLDVSVDLTDDLITHHSITLVLQGLPTGAVASPRMMRWFIGRIEENLDIKGATVWLSYADNLAVGAHTLSAVEAVRQAVVKHCSGLLAGPLSFNDPGIVHRNKLLLLNNRYRERTAFDGTKSVHVTPSRKRFERLEWGIRAIADPLIATGQDYTYAVLRYAMRWYGAQVSWTKTGNSKSWFKSVLTSYFLDLANGDPVGTFYREKDKNGAASGAAISSLAA